MAETSIVRRRRVKDVVEHKRRLVEVPYTASIADSVQVMAANDVVAVAVAAPPGKWTGAGGSMILACLKPSGALSKHYIGILSMLDILVHIAESDDMSLSVSSIIGHSLEGLSLWTINPNTRFKLVGDFSGTGYPSVVKAYQGDVFPPQPAFLATHPSQKWTSPFKLTNAESGS